MDYFPIFLKLADAPVLVVGGGGVAARKARLLLKAKARVIVAAPEVCESLAQACVAGEVEHLPHAFAADMLDGCRAVIAATDDRMLNRTVSALCQARGIPVNVVDDPALCSFIMPAIVDRSPLVIAISSSGRAPVLARQLRARLESMIPAGYGRLARIAGEWRERVKARLPIMDVRLRFWESIFDGPVAERVLADDRAGAEHLLREALNGGDGASTAGEVYLVGAGPGDPDLLTFRALRLMQQADVVLYDHLVSDPILDLVRRDAERIYVGKRCRKHTVPQETLNAMLVRLARGGKRVLRLKGGDPFIFGRGGEEIETLAAEGIAFQIVPGITAASGCAAYAGIPLTHRDHAQSCVFVTGHASRDGKLNLHWDALARLGQTVVIYMGVNSLPSVCRALREHGLPDTHPAALVERGTTQAQRVITGTLATLPEQVRRDPPAGPGLVIVGEVVRLHHRLQWFATSHPASDEAEPSQDTVAVADRQQIACPEGCGNSASRYQRETGGACVAARSSSR